MNILSHSEVIARLELLAKQNDMINLLVNPKVTFPQIVKALSYRDYLRDCLGQDDRDFIKNQLQKVLDSGILAYGTA